MKSLPLSVTGENKPSGSNRDATICSTVRFVGGNPTGSTLSCFNDIVSFWVSHECPSTLTESDFTRSFSSKVFDTVLSLDTHSLRFIDASLNIDFASL